MWAHTVTPGAVRLLRRRACTGRTWTSPAPLCSPRTVTAVHTVSPFAAPGSAGFCGEIAPRLANPGLASPEREPQPVKIFSSAAGGGHAEGVMPPKRQRPEGVAKKGLYRAGLRLGQSDDCFSQAEDGGVTATLCVALFGGRGGGKETTLKRCEKASAAGGCGPPVWRMSF